MIERAVILAIGSPNHSSVLTYNRTHAMLPALGKPLVARVMDRLYRVGIRQYTIIVGENEGPVAAYLNTQWVPDAKIDFMLKPSGIGLERILSNIAAQYGNPFLICSYNSFTHTNFPASLLKYADKSPDDLVLTGATSTLSKSSHYFAAAEGTLVKDILRAKPSETSVFTLADFAVCGNNVVEFLRSISKNGGSIFRWNDIAQKYVQSGGQASIAETSWILQIEADRDLLTLNKHLLNEGQDAHILSEIPYTVQITPPVRIDPQVSVGQGAKIGPHVYLERGCSVGHEVTIRNSIILERANVPSTKSVSDTIISTRGPIP